MSECIDFTVAIPTFNGEGRLPELLERLKRQMHAEQILWEIIVVDNNSRDNTLKVVQSYQVNWEYSYPLRYYLETQQGAAFARQRAVKEAKGKFIGFLDDDNYPALDWVIEAFKFSQKYQNLGAFGGQIHGEFEVEPPENFDKIACFLAINQRGSEPHRYEPKKKMLPPGAGLVVCKQAWCENVPKQLVLNHKGKEALLASEDLEAVLHIQLGGWQIWYNPKMHIYHQIPAWRLQKEYLVRLIRCVGLSRHHLRMLRLQRWQRPLASLLYLMNDARKLIFYFFKHRLILKQNLIKTCEMELLTSSLISPFHLFKIKNFD
jgi:glycosyltransferase involved in cell wall biosynthesis